MEEEGKGRQRKTMKHNKREKNMTKYKADTVTKEDKLEQK